MMYNYSLSSWLFSLKLTSFLNKLHFFFFSSLPHLIFLCLCGIYVYMLMCCVFLCVQVPVETRGQWWRSFSIALHLIFWSRVLICFLLCFVTVRGQLMGITFLFPPCGKRLNSGCQAWRQEPLPFEPSHWTESFDFFKTKVAI